MTKVVVNSSSTIKSFEYDAHIEVMVVEFKAGSKYSYTGVPPSVVLQFGEAESKGKYFAANIKDRYHAEKLEAPKELAPWPFPVSQERP